MSRTCYKKGPGSTIMELDIYSDRNLSVDTECPNGWSEDVESTEGYDGPLQCDGGNADETTTCYRCDGNVRQVVTHCGTRQCPDTYDSYPIKCNYPGVSDMHPQGKTYDVQYCACQELDGTVTGYSPLCCPKQQKPQAQTSIPTSGGASKIPWFAWIVLGIGIAYFIKVQDKTVN